MIAKGTTPIVEVTRASYVDSLRRATRLHLTAEDMATLESVADAASVGTRGWWEQDMAAA